MGFTKEEEEHHHHHGQPPNCCHYFCLFLFFYFLSIRNHQLLALMGAREVEDAVCTFIWNSLFFFTF